MKFYRKIDQYDKIGLSMLIYTKAIFFRKKGLLIVGTYKMARPECTVKFIRRKSAIFP